MDLDQKGKPRNYTNKSPYNKSHYAQYCSKGHFIGVAFLPTSRSWENPQGEVPKWKEKA